MKGKRRVRVKQLGAAGAGRGIPRKGLHRLLFRGFSASSNIQVPIQGGGQLLQLEHLHARSERTRQDFCT